jgi:K+-transporting ATPase ATPase B chain
MATHAKSKSKSLWDRNILRRALVDSVLKLSPRSMMKNPVMFVGSGQRGDDAVVVHESA